MRIGIDVMGGDHAPHAILAGALDGLKLLAAEDRLLLVGDASIIQAGLAERGLSDDPRIEIEATTLVITMDESAVAAVREKKGSSLVRLAELCSPRTKERHCDMGISAGNTGAAVASAQMMMRRLPGVHRPGIAVTLPTFKGPVVLCDVGANPEPRPPHLHQYGHMGAIYAQRLLGVEKPRVALMNIGGEEGKGNALVKETAARMKADTTMNYVGYVEGRELFARAADVVVTEGFTGNVIIKVSEGLAGGIFKSLGQEFAALSPEMAKNFAQASKSIHQRYDYHEYGGAPLLGANGVYIKCHGASESRTITNAMRTAFTLARTGLNDGIIEALAKAPVVAGDE